MWEYYYTIRMVIILFFVLLLLLCILLPASLIKKRIKYRSGREKFFSILSMSFMQQQINNKEDILLLLNSISREFDSSYLLISILEDYIVYISKDEEKILKDINKSNIHNLIKEVIRIENQEKPFNNVPDEEKMILRNINENIKNNQLESVKFNLQELSSVIAARNKIYEKANKTNRWSLPITILSIIFAIVFGLMGLKSIDYKKIEEINSKLIEKNIKE